MKLIFTDIYWVKPYKTDIHWVIQCMAQHFAMENLHVETTYLQRSDPIQNHPSEPEELPPIFPIPKNWFVKVFIGRTIGITIGITMVHPAWWFIPRIVSG